MEVMEIAYIGNNLTRLAVPKRWTNRKKVMKSWQITLYLKDLKDC